MYAEGVATTLTLLASSLLVGGVLALAFALALTSNVAVLRWLVGAYTYVIRGTPLLIQVYLIYYGIAQLEWVQERWNDVWPWTHFKEPFFCALLAFSLNTAGYTAEMIAGAPGSIQVELVVDAEMPVEADARADRLGRRLERVNPLFAGVDQRVVPGRGGGLRCASSAHSRALFELGEPSMPTTMRGATPYS